MTTKMQATTEDDFLEGMEEVKPPFWKRGKVGDYLKGTFVEMITRASNYPGKIGQNENIYTVKVIKGSYHEMDEKKNPIEPPKVLEVGSFCYVGGFPSFDKSMKMIKIGQIFAVKFFEEKPPKVKGMNGAKLVKVFHGEMDPDYEPANLENDPDLQLPPV